jgi:hypothetical protein
LNGSVQEQRSSAENRNVCGKILRQIGKNFKKNERELETNLDE